MTSTNSRLQKAFSASKKSLVAYLTAGDPSVDECVAAARAAVDNGVDVLEIGVPFSDPVADGPVIQRAMLRALDNGGGFIQALQIVERIRSFSQVPIVLFGYANPLFWEGLDAACCKMKQAGVDGLLVVDVPGEEAGPMRNAAAQAGLDWVALVAPTTGIERAAKLAQEATGFVYVISMTGVTGGALVDTKRIEPVIAAVRQAATIPVCVGFGVRDRASAQAVAKVADGVVVGSAIVAALEAGQQDGTSAQRVANCIKELRTAIDEREFRTH